MRSGFLAAIALAMASAATEAPAAERGQITLPSGVVDVRLDVDGRQRAKIVMQEANRGRIRTIPLSSPGEVLPILIDRRFAFLWPELTAWAGPDLVILRDRMLAESEAAYAAGKLPAWADKMAALVSRKTAVVLSRAKVLSAAGRRSEAVAFLEKQTRAWTPGKPWDRNDQGVALLTLANLLFNVGRADDAADLLLAFEAETTARAEVLNVVLTRANLLALVGRYQEALEAIDKGEAMFVSYKDTFGGTISALPGTNRYFARIRACALRGLGRRQEAEAALAPLLAAPPQPYSLFWELDPTNLVELGAFTCMRDPARLAPAMTRGLDSAPVSATALNLIIPQIITPHDQATLIAARASPTFEAAARDIIRPLPPELVPAANDWNAPGR